MFIVTTLYLDGKANHSNDDRFDGKWDHEHSLAVVQAYIKVHGKPKIEINKESLCFIWNMPNKDYPSSRWIIRFKKVNCSGQEIYLYFKQTFS